MLDQLKKEMHSLARRERALVSQKYFKTGPGEYGAGDLFIGLTVPQVRSVAKQYRELSLPEVTELLASAVHEERQAALEILDLQFARGGDALQKEIVDLYLANTRYVNNWDLVDGSAPYILGLYLLKDPNRALLTRLARSTSLWERRIAIVATFAFLKQKDAAETLRIAELLLKDEHDLIHKAVGWALREAGKTCGIEIEEAFLKKHYKAMPRTMLRYAIERFEPEKRQKYLVGEI